MGRKKKYTSVIEISKNLRIGFGDKVCAFGIKVGEQINWLPINPRELASLLANDELKSMLIHVFDNARDALIDEKAEKDYNERLYQLSEATKVE